MNRLFLGWDRPAGMTTTVTTDRSIGIVEIPRKRFVLETSGDHDVTCENLSCRIVRESFSEGYFNVLRTRITLDGRDIGYFDVSVPYGGSCMDAVVDEIHVTEGKVILEKVETK